METIMLVDDEPEILQLLRMYFGGEGYRLLTAENGREALEALEREKVDLIVLDVMMPVMNGIETCAKLRERHNMPVIMLSAKGQDDDKIAGLGIGADDYVVKPFNPLEVVARVRSQLRRYNRLGANTAAESGCGGIAVDGLTIDTDNRRVTVEGGEVHLTPREFAILELLARTPGHVFSTEQIYDRVWNEPFMESSNTIMVHVRKIREKIERDAKKPRYIQTVWGVGYKFRGNEQ
ncbi:response regulator transcription factor [Saccharibacillus sp. CPCC 101409]|uniref:response regulator transcription factor n=1 Tax=Saccharibacillus sp. CPCC 101409 TaxID=3058041 RepID=UPI002671BA69|nr:response regulator transcription factor [Saccharibacillus sp. CPCC 101409]MDO3411105.1 response regulator transcription factor [Saccharibacillus sp. CPCC 101409]